jgi:hypothetical protein
VSNEEPWAGYAKDKLPRGWAYPLGRDEVRAALVAAGAVVGRLWFSRTDANFEGRMVLHAYWPSDARSKYLDTGEHGRSPLLMWVSAVPSDLRQDISRELRETWLGPAAEWAAKAPMRGNAWTASDHYWIIRYTKSSGLVLEES